MKGKLESATKCKFYSCWKQKAYKRLHAISGRCTVSRHLLQLHNSISVCTLHVEFSSSRPTGVHDDFYFNYLEYLNAFFAFFARSPISSLLS